MKIIIILSLAAICLAKSRKAFHFPSSAKAVNHIVFEPENGKSHNSEKSSEESDLVLSNPSRRDVKIESPVFGFRGKAGNSGGIKNISPEEPIFIENTTSVLEKGKSSSSEESQAVDDKQEASSSEESNQEEANAADANQNVSSGEENKAAAVNQDDSSNEENSLQAIKEKEASSEEINATNANQDTSNDEQIIKPAESQEEPKIKVFNGKANRKIPFQPFSRAIKLIPRDVDGERPEAAKHSRGRGHRLLRSIELNLPELDIKPNVQGPQGSIQTAKKRVRRPAKQ
ncbi:uncharacterized protein LOC143768424 [Ranitomeya variabilis]|uniref:uncharacterized protein LOC143768424 n=1 Tax=Ranitomeya variabilis TaxID=490064 RepID=UPI004056AACD